jgi:hypothetical protein
VESFNIGTTESTTPTQASGYVTLIRWLSQFKNDSTPVGDLARDVRFDKEFPRHSDSRKHLRDYLESMGACDSAMSIFEEAFSHYEQDAKN